MTTEGKRQGRADRSVSLAFILLVALMIINPGGCKEKCEANVNGARRILVIDRLIREGDPERLQKYIDQQLQMDLYGITYFRRFFIRPQNSMQVASDIVSYFDTYRNGEIQMTFGKNRESFNKYIRAIAKTVRERQDKKAEQ